MAKKTKIKRRPRRLFKDEKQGRYFYLIDGKKKYIKASDITSDKQIARINIKNVLPVKVIRKTVRPRSSINPITNQQLISKLAPIAQNLTDKKYDIYKVKDKDDLEKRLTKIEEKQKLEDTKAGEKKGLFNPTKLPKPTSGNVLKNAYNMWKQRQEDDEILKKQLKEKADADKKAVDKGFSTTNPDPAVADKGDIGYTEKPRTAVDVIRGTNKRYTENMIVELAKSYSAYQYSFPPYEWVVSQVKSLSGYQQPGFAVYQRAKDRYVPQPPPNTTAIEELKTEEEPTIDLVRTGNITTFGSGISTFYKMNGNGEYENDDDGIYNDELQEIFSDKMNKFLPVIASDKMYTLLPLVDKDTRKFGWIQNTESSDSMGRHWVAYFIDIPNMEINYYDSLVENDGEPPKESLKGLKRIIDKIHPEYYLLFKYSTIRDQHPSSKNCGYFALKFIMDRYRNVPFKSATGYDSIYGADDRFSDDDESPMVIDNFGEGEQMIKRFKKYL